jgi:CRISPR-associated protein (TIGR03986 family)
VAAIKGVLARAHGGAWEALQRDLALDDLVVTTAIPAPRTNPRRSLPLPLRLAVFATPRGLVVHDLALEAVPGLLELDSALMPPCFLPDWKDAHRERARRAGPPGAAAGRDDFGRAGALRVYDARCLTDPPPLLDTATRIAIDPITRAARDHHLFSEQRVPAGTRFRCRFELDRIDLADLDAFIAALSAFDGGAANGLGAGRSRLYGRLRWTADGLRVRTLSRADHLQWLCTDQDLDRLYQEQVVPLPGTDPTGTLASGPVGAARRLVLRIYPRSPLLVSIQPRRTDGARTLHRSFRLDGGQVQVPASSLKGMLRAQARRILLTILVHRHPRVPEARRREVADTLLGAVFGNTAAMAGLLVDEARGAFDPDRDVHPQTFNAIDPAGHRAHLVRRGRVRGRGLGRRLGRNHRRGPGRRHRACAGAPPMTDDTFYSPYQFIPVTGRLHQGAAPDTPVPTTDWAAISAGTTQVRHDCQAPGTLSGRLLCRLTTVTPTLVGAEQTDGDPGLPGTLTNYRNHGELAIPAGSLRGAVGAVAEAISQSAMRVLDQREFSVRKAMNGSLKAIGLLRRQPDGSWRLLPLAMTWLPNEPKSDPPRVRIPAPWKQVFPATLSLSECLAVYYGVYGDADNDPARFDCFQEQDKPGFVWSAQAVDARLADAGIDQVYEIQGGADPLQAKGSFAVRRGWLQDVQTTAAGLDGQPMRGVPYVLGLRADRMEKKTHEWFVPYAEDWEARLAAARSDGKATLRVSPKAIADFERLALERWQTNDAKTRDNDRVPFLPKGYGLRRPAGGAGAAGCLRDGDLVYFDVDRTGREVIEVSFSSIWRRAVDGDLHAAFVRVAGRDALPWNGARDALTPAECLFGVVEELPKNKARNLASRVRFSDALALDRPTCFYPAAVALCQLQSPKPPSPAMYFRTASGGAVRKQDFDLTTQVPNGRKHYLVHDPHAVKAKRPWETRKLDTIDRTHPTKEDRQLLEDYARQGGRYGNPLADGQDFWFHVDFDHLTEAELGLLCSAIDPGLGALNPDPLAEFHHRLGWGRPVGLGVVRIVVEGLFLIDRPQRYSARGFDKPRYQFRWLAPGDQPIPDALGRRYHDELAQGPLARSARALPVAGALIDQDALRALLRLGDVNAIDHPVCYPYAYADDQHRNQDQKPYGETEGYAWFVNNDDPRQEIYQSLAPLTAGEGAEPGLPQLRPNRPYRRR